MHKSFKRFSNKKAIKSGSSIFLMFLQKRFLGTHFPTTTFPLQVFFFYQGDTVAQRKTDKANIKNMRS